MPFWIVEPAGRPQPHAVAVLAQPGRLEPPVRVVGYLKYWTVTGRPDTARAYRRFGVAGHVYPRGVERSRYLDIDGPVFVADFGGEGEPIVCVHGLGGSHVNWVPAAAGLAELGAVSAIDLPGFGLTPPAGRSTTVEANRRILDRYLRTLGRPVTLIGNSMGGAIAVRRLPGLPRPSLGWSSCPRRRPGTWRSRRPTHWVGRCSPSTSFPASPTWSCGGGAAS